MCIWYVPGVFIESLPPTRSISAVVAPSAPHSTTTTNEQQCEMEMQVQMSANLYWLPDSLSFNNLFVCSYYEAENGNWMEPAEQQAKWTEMDE